jgi:hypothetical protein
MSYKVTLALTVLFLPLTVFAASFHFTPEATITDEPFTLYLGIGGMVDVKGMDVVLEWDAGVLSCSGAEFAGEALPTFTEFHRMIDNGAGLLEILLLQQCEGGCTGDADSFLVLTFDPVLNGSTGIIVRMVNPWGDPVLVDVSNNGVEFEADTALVTVENVDPVPGAAVLKLHQNYPNPFNPTTTIRFDIPERSAVHLRIYDIGGRLVAALIEGAEYEEGTWAAEWDGRNNEGRLVPSGVYFCFIEAAGRESSRKLVILR